MNLRFLYDPKRRLFTIGYNVDDRRFDSSYYDLLASEARLASLVAIARGDVPAEHWFALGRPFGTARGHRVLFSWSGTMFEYLMPLLVMPTYENSLIDQTYRAVVQRQIEFRKTHDLQHLVALVGQSALELQQELAPCDWLTPFGIEFRYPGEYLEVDRVTAQKALAEARRVRDLVLRALGLQNSTSR
jgi:hypothetical protein